MDKSWANIHAQNLWGARQWNENARECRRWSPRGRLWRRWRWLGLGFLASLRFLDLSRTQHHDCDDWGYPRPLPAHAFLASHQTAAKPQTNRTRSRRRPPVHHPSLSSTACSHAIGTSSLKRDRACLCMSLCPEVKGAPRGQFAVNPVTFLKEDGIEK